MVLANDGNPAGLCGLPGSLVLAAHIGSVDQLIAVDRISVDDNAQCGACGRLESNRHLTKIKVDVRHNLASLHGNCVQGEGIVVAGQKIRGQHLVAALIVGFIENPVVEPGAVGSGGQRSGPGHIIRNLVVPVEVFKGHIGSVGYGR